MLHRTLPANELQSCPPVVIPLRIRWNLISLLSDDSQKRYAHWRLCSPLAAILRLRIFTLRSILWWIRVGTQFMEGTCGYLRAVLTCVLQMPGQFFCKTSSPGPFYAGFSPSPEMDLHFWIHILLKDARADKSTIDRIHTPATKGPQF